MITFHDYLFKAAISPQVSNVFETPQIAYSHLFGENISIVLRLYENQTEQNLVARNIARVARWTRSPEATARTSDVARIYQKEILEGITLRSAEAIKFLFWQDEIGNVSRMFDQDLTVEDRKRLEFEGEEVKVDWNLINAYWEMAATSTQKSSLEQETREDSYNTRIFVIKPIMECLGRTAYREQNPSAVEEVADMVTDQKTLDLLRTYNHYLALQTTPRVIAHLTSCSQNRDEFLERLDAFRGKLEAELRKIDKMS